MAGSGLGNMSKRFFGPFTALTQDKQHLRNREVVFRVVLVGTGLVMLAFFALLLLSFSLLHNTYVLDRAVICGLAFIYIVGIYYLSRTKFYRLAASLLVGFYMVLAIGTVWQWGINTPLGVLLLGLVIVLASTLLESRHALTAALISGVSIIGLQLGQKFGWVTPDLSWNQHRSSLGDAFGYCIVFAILALISWLFGRQTERSLVRAQQAEVALLREKATLKIRVKERTAELHQAQVEELQQLYQFAEVGQMSTALLHDLANHLTVLTLEIEGIHSQKHSAAIKRTQHIVSHLDTMVTSVRDRLKGTASDQAFNLAATIDEIVEFDRYKRGDAAIRLVWEAPKPTSDYSYSGDPLRLSQIVAIVVSNAVEAYATDKSATPQKPAVVDIRLDQTSTHFTIHVTDYGVGITAKRRKTLFHPYTSTKKTGMGIGLYLAKQMIEANFSGTIKLSPDLARTEFIISLPREH